MTTITLHHGHHGHLVRRPRLVHLAVVGIALLGLGFVASTALGPTGQVQGPPASIEIYSDMNRESVTVPAADAPALEITAAPSSLDVLSAMNGEPG